jgi:hypothetical protein
MPLVPDAPQRPDSTVLSEPIQLFAIGCNKAGGVFWSKTAAIRFAKTTGGSMFVTDGLELEQASPQAGGGSNPVTSQIAKAIAAIRLRARDKRCVGAKNQSARSSRTQGRVSLIHCRSFLIPASVSDGI